MGADKWRRGCGSRFFLVVDNRPSFPMTDRFAAIDYDALIDWQTRLTREAPFLERALAGIPSRRLLDLGCGPGHHARLLASRGFDVVGIDASPSMLQVSWCGYTATWPASAS